MKITVISGKAHIKHTEGGDFRQATYRAVRQGLMSAKSVLLEPMYDFTLTVPSECVGRAISDIHQKFGTNDPPITKEDYSILKGRVPASEMTDYHSEVLSYTGGRGRLSVTFSGYSRCHNEDEIIQLFEYNPTLDLENTPDSVFCSHGAGVNVSWDKVIEYCHIPPIKSRDNSENKSNAVHRDYISHDIDEAELEQIMLREFGPIKRKTYSPASVSEPKIKYSTEKITRIIVDGYNVIFSWDNLKIIAKDNLDLAREKLITILTNYQAYLGLEIVLVFDAYLVDSCIARKYDSNKLHVVYTDKGISADSYIEKLVDEIGKNENVKVVSSDSMIQLTAVKSGVLRISSREFKYDVDLALENMRKHIN